MENRLSKFALALASALRLALAAALLALALVWRWPLWVELRPLLLVAVPAGAALLAAWEAGGVRSQPRRSGRLARAVGALTGLAAAAALVVSLGAEARFRWIRREVLRAEPARLARLGAHVVVGYRDRAALETLLARRAVGGVFVGAVNAEGRSAEQLAQELAAFQAARARAGDPPLWIAADQEGGPVSRLSPPLPRQPGPAALEADCAAPGDGCERAVLAWASLQARGLARLGVNLDLAPVVDLRGAPVPGDRYSRIHERAISADPAVVARVADAYCAALSREGVGCALKHFPGLGRVRADTHRDAATLDASPADLAAADWLPFEVARGHPARFTMIAHARLAAVDPARPASTSPAVVNELLRGARGHDGPLVTDDLGMLALYRSEGGIGEGAVRALEAGVDLLLVSYDPDQYYEVMHALLEAERAGRLGGAALAASDARLERARRALGR
jgi:beta-N-acetylhexosaminidase